jgi:serine protease
MGRSSSTHATRARRVLATTALLAGMLALSGLTGAAGAAHADGADNGSGAGTGGHHHKVEHPTIEGARNRAPKPAAKAVSGGQLAYGGGVHGIGVTTGQPKVYLVFWGAGWGTATTTSGTTTLSGDTKGEAPRLQQFFRGLGTNSELWSGVLTQYCEGVTVGTTTCPVSAPHVGYPAATGALAGVLVDPTSTRVTSSGSTATSPVDHDLAAEAVWAAAQFGNTTAASNRSAQYVIVSPPGTHPGGFGNVGQNWCAWHDWNGDTTLVGGAAASSIGDIAFTNFPYVTDLGTSCGQNYVNAGAAGTLDGVTIVEGHEYAETVTDQNPAGGWIDSLGYENGDKCSWIGVGGVGGSQNIALASGTFAVQGTWSNDGATCLVAHSVVTSASNDFSLAASPTSIAVAAGASGSSTVSTAVTLGAAQTVNLSATAPAGITATLAAPSVTAGGSTTLNVSVAPGTSAGSYAVAVTGNEAGVVHTATVTVTVPGVLNGGFESAFTGWSRAGTTSITTSAPHGGTSSALAGRNGRTNGDSSVTQTFTATGTTLSFWYKVRCGQTVSVDWATATLTDTTTATVTTPLPKTCTNTGAWVQVTAPVVAGHSYTLKLTNHDNNQSTSGAYTNTQFDDVTA